MTRWKFDDAIMALICAWNDSVVFDKFSAIFLGPSQYNMIEDFGNK